MKRIKVKLKDLRPNPYKKEIQGGFIDPIKVAQIKESAEKTSFWEQWVVRETAKGYELAFGHHRLEAALELFGPSYEVSIQVEDYSDEQMLVALANENAGQEETIEAQADVMRVSKTYLVEHPEACKFNPVRLSNRVNRTEAQRQADNKKATENHEHGSVRCLLAFLGESNWNIQKISDLIVIADKLDASVLKDVANDGADGHPERRGTVGITAAVEISKLDKPVQKAVVIAIKEANKELHSFQKAEVAERQKKKLPHSAVKEMSTHIPASVVKQAVKRAADLPPAKQAQAIVQHIKQKVAERKEFAIEASLPTAEKVVSKIVAQLNNLPNDDTMQELLGNREYLSHETKKSLRRAFRRLVERVTGYDNTLFSPPQKKLTGGTMESTPNILSWRPRTAETSRPAQPPE